jgi:hypothetical protein
VLGAGIVATAPALAMALVLGAAPHASAQEVAEVTVEAVHPLGGGEFHFIVDVASGGAPASDATVTATPTGPGGDTGSAVALDPTGDGVYQGPVSLPEDGTWSVRIDSSGPTGTLDYGYEVRGDTGTPAATTPPTTAPATTAAPAEPATTTTVAPATTTSTSSADVPSTEVDLASDGDDDGGSSNLPVVLLVVAAALVIAVAGVPLALRTIRQSTGASPPAHDADDATGKSEGTGDDTGPRISD